MTSLHFPFQFLSFPLPFLKLFQSFSSPSAAVSDPCQSCPPSRTLPRSRQDRLALRETNCALVQPYSLENPTFSAPHTLSRTTPYPESSNPPPLLQPPTQWKTQAANEPPSLTRLSNLSIWAPAGYEQFNVMVTMLQLVEGLGLPPPL